MNNAIFVNKIVSNIYICDVIYKQSLALYNKQLELYGYIMLWDIRCNRELCHTLYGMRV